MLIEIIIALFWIGIWLALKVLRRNPDSIAARFAFSWHGPYPEEGERLSSYYRRKVWFALGWLLELLLVSAILGILAWWVPVIRNAEPFLIFSGFALTIGLGMATLGAILVWLASLKARLIGPDPIFSSALDFSHKEDEEKLD